MAPIDTLLFSGAGPSGLAYTGVLQAMIDHGIISTQLTNIKHMIVTSIGILSAISLLLHIDNKVLQEIVMKYNLDSFTQLDSLSIDDILLDGGLFETNQINEIVRSLCRHTLSTNDISLKDLYQHTNITLSVKVFNVTTSHFEFISHTSHPNLPIATLAQMTTAIPIFFKPVTYQGSIYCDGGFREGYPSGCPHSPNYLGIRLQGNCGGHVKSICKDIPILHLLTSILSGKEDLSTLDDDPRIITIEGNLGLSFDINDHTKQKLIQHAYNTTISHLKSHSIFTPPQTTTDLYENTEPSHPS